MTEREFLQQLFLLRQDIAATPMLDRFAADQRERWAARLGDLINRRLAVATVPEDVVAEIERLPTMTADDNLRPDDAALLRAIAAAPDGVTTARLIYAYYDDLDRAERTPRSMLYLHLGMLSGIIAHLLTLTPDCDCRNPRCGHKASQHVGPEGACVEAGCPCGPGGWR